MPFNKLDNRNKAETKNINVDAFVSLSSSLDEITAPCVMQVPENNDMFRERISRLARGDETKYDDGGRECAGRTKTKRTTTDDNTGVDLHELSGSCRLGSVS